MSVMLRGGGIIGLVLLPVVIFIGYLVVSSISVVEPSAQLTSGPEIVPSITVVLEIVISAGIILGFIFWFVGQQTSSSEPEVPTPQKPAPTIVHKSRVVSTSENVLESLVEELTGKDDKTTES